MFVTTGKLSAKSLIKEGVSEKGAWKVIMFLLEKTRKRKPIKIPIIAKGKLASLIDSTMIGEKITVKFYIEGKKFNEKYFTDCVAIEVEKYVPKAKYEHGHVSFNGEVLDERHDILKEDNNLFNNGADKI
jgi:hypothetical protein